jgi:hypothetical protein
MRWKRSREKKRRGLRRRSGIFRKGDNPPVALRSRKRTAFSLLSLFSLFSLLSLICVITGMVTLAAGLSGCAGKRIPGDPLEALFLSDPETLYRSLVEGNGRMRTLEGTARLRIQTEERTARLEATLVCERPESLRCEITDFLDHLIFLIVVQDGQILSYSVAENRFSQGKALPGRIQDFLGVPLGVEELISLFLGCPFFVTVNDPVCHFSANEGEVLLNVSDPSMGISYKVTLDREGRPEESLLVRTEPGSGETHRIRAVFRKYRGVGGMAFPFRIRVSEEGAERHFQVDYHEVDVNRELLDGLFEFVPPPDAEQVPW